MSGFTSVLFLERSCKSVQCESKIMLLSKIYVLVQFLAKSLSYNSVGDASHGNNVACAPLYWCTFLLN